MTHLRVILFLIHFLITDICFDDKFPGNKRGKSQVFNVIATRDFSYLAILIITRAVKQNYKLINRISNNYTTRALKNTNFILQRCFTLIGITKNASNTSILCIRGINDQSVENAYNSHN